MEQVYRGDYSMFNKDRSMTLREIKAMRDTNPKVTLAEAFNQQDYNSTRLAGCCITFPACGLEIITALDVNM